MKIKVLFCLFFNVFISIIFYKAYSENKIENNIKENQLPIHCYVFNIERYAKSTPSCSIRYNGKVYNLVKITDNPSIIEGQNNKDFYYDKDEDSIFYVKKSNNILYIIFIFLIISILLWFIPSKKFTW